MEEYFGIREIECSPVQTNNVKRKTKPKRTALGFFTFGLSALAFAAYAFIAVRYFLGF